MPEPEVQILRPAPRPAAKPAQEKPAARGPKPRVKQPSEDSDAAGDESKLPTVPGYSATDQKPKPVEDLPKKDLSESGTGIPKVAEWEDFIGRILLRTLLNGYSAMILKDYPLTDRERDDIFLSNEDLKDMAVPFATFANQNKFLRKNGRQIIAFSDSAEALLAMAIWLRRVNRIGKKYRPKHARPVVPSVDPNHRQETEQNGSSSNGRSTGTNAESWDAFGPQIFNPGAG